MNKGDRYRHYKGNTYEIIEPKAIIESGLEPAVVYRSEESGLVWVKTRDDFFKLVTDGANVLNRFSLIEEQEPGGLAFTDFTKASPVLTGEDAVRFHEQMLEAEELARNPTPELIAERKRIKDLYTAMKAKGII